MENFLHYATQQRTLLLLVSVLAVGLHLRGQAGVSPRTYTAVTQDIQGGHADRAVATLRKELARFPKDVRLRNLLGLAQTQLRQLPKADREFERALVDDPSFTPALRNLAVNESTLGQNRQSQAHFRQLLGMSPNDPVANAYLGSSLFIAGKLDEALPLLQKAGFLKSDPTIAMESNVAAELVSGATQGDVNAAVNGLALQGVDARALRSAAAQLAQRSMLGPAATLYRALPPEAFSQPNTVYNFAVCLLGLKQAEEAQAVLQRYFAVHTASGDLLDLSAEAYEATQQQQLAIDTLRRAIALEPDIDDHYIALAELCSRYDAYDVGIQLLDVGLHLRPNADRLLFERGVLEGMKNDYVAAERDLRQAQALAPGKSGSSIALGVDLMQTGKTAEAIQELRAKLAVDADNAMLNYLLAEALLRNGAVPGDTDYQEAKTALARALAVDAKFVPALVSMARQQVREGQYDTARGLLQQAVRIDPADRNAYSQLAIVERKLGHKAEAEAALTALNTINEQQRREDHRLRITVAEAH